MVRCQARQSAVLERLPTMSRKPVWSLLEVKHGFSNRTDIAFVGECPVTKSKRAIQLGIDICWGDRRWPSLGRSA